MTRPLGVRMDGPTGRRLWPPDGGGLCRRVEKGKVLRIDGPFRAQGFLSLTAFQAEGCGIALSGDEYKVSVTGLAFCVIGLDWHSGDWLAALASHQKGRMHFLARRAVVKVLYKLAPSINS